jgi:hypothetical protein
MNQAWINRAGELAEWAWRMVNRRDAWGGYHRVAERGREYTDKDGAVKTLGRVTTRPLPRDRGKVLLTKEVLVRHFAAEAPEHVVGLHTTSPENTSRWGAVEVDQHGDGGNSPEANFAASLAWHDELIRRGFRPLLTDSNGRGGYHLRLLLDQPAPTSRVFAFLKGLVADFARHGLTAAPECFPKQPAVPAGRYGNWLRLPGLHHTREHRSTVWDGGCCWLSGEDAVDHLLTFRGDSPELLPPEPPPPPPHRRAGKMLLRFRGGGKSRAERIAAYMARLPNLGEGQGRDDVAYNFAAFLVRDMEVSDSVALEWLEQWDAHNTPPKGKAALEKVVANAHSYGRHSYGSAGERPECGRTVVIPTGRPGHVIIRSRMEVF